MQKLPRFVYDNIFFSLLLLYLEYDSVINK